MKKSGYDVEKLKKVIDILASGALLPASYKDHGLAGALAGARECHIAPDWLLVYAKYEEELVLMLLRTGTHRDALGIE